MISDRASKNIFDETLFSFLLEIELDNEYIDLHNDYYCSYIDLRDSNIMFYFNHNDILSHVIHIIFTDIEVVSLNMNFSNSDQESLVLDNLHRGRYLFDNVLYDEYKDRHCFYLEFVNGIDMSLLCKQAFIKFYDGPTAEKVNTTGKKTVIDLKIRLEKEN